MFYLKLPFVSLKYAIVNLLSNNYLMGWVLFWLMCSFTVLFGFFFLMDHCSYLQFLSALGKKNQ